MIVDSTHNSPIQTLKSSKLVWKRSKLC